MKCKEIIEELEKKYSRDLAVDWDNPGLQAGRREKNIRSIYIGLDATDEVIADAVKKGADMILTHHPLLMSPMKQINSDSFIGRRLITIIQQDICCYAMHTNYDIVTMAPLSGRMMNLQQPEVMEITGENLKTGEREGLGRIGSLPKAMTLRECCECVKEVFGIRHVKVYGELDKMIERAAISPGSGKSMAAAAISHGADVLISGDFGHHDGIDAMAQGLAVIDAGHYGLEHIFVAQMEAHIKEHFPQIQVYCEKMKNPFEIV